LGKNWQRDYIVWDMCCGVGNLEVKHSNHRNLYMSTLDQSDIDVMRATRTCVSAQRFQYDYLNDDIDDFGQIDYSLTNKLPQALRDAIADAKAGKPGAKKILVLINPPYAEAMNVDNITESDGANAESKKGVAATRVGLMMRDGDYGYAARELFVQFMVRIANEMPNATLAMFSKLKYINAPNFDKFRTHWNAEFKDGFIVHSKAFDGLKGNFPIGFLIWQTKQTASKRSPITSIEVEILDKCANPIGSKTFSNLPTKSFLSEWIKRVRPNDQDALPLKNALTPTTSTKDVRGMKWAEGAIGGMICKGNDLQNAGTQTALLSSGYCSAGGFLVTEKNLWQAAIVFAVRRLIKPTWINDRDQFLQPSQPLSDAFKQDCLIWMLFNGSNLTASANGLEWNGRQWSIVNHFIPFTEAEVNAPDRFESDFMVQYSTGKPFSPEAKAVLDAGRDLWRAYFAETPPFIVRDELKLNRPDVGWYQVRNALKRRNGTGDSMPVDFSAFDTAYRNLSDKLKPLVYEYGFLMP
jgi:hypothetical protein